ncbi:MAG: hypothetical protein MZV64_11395 [Ignavibacteriales bacterium]|nr:hypothetical protein [Ignavibacteriales bacterium]
MGQARPQLHPLVQAVRRAGRRAPDAARPGHPQVRPAAPRPRLVQQQDGEPRGPRPRAGLPVPDGRPPREVAVQQPDVPDRGLSRRDDHRPELGGGRAEAGLRAARHDPQQLLGPGVAEGQGLRLPVRRARRQDRQDPVPRHHHGRPGRIDQFERQRDEPLGRGPHQRRQARRYAGHRRRHPGRSPQALHDDRRHLDPARHHRARLRPGLDGRQLPRARPRPPRRQHRRLLGHGQPVAERRAWLRRPDQQERDRAGGAAHPDSGRQDLGPRGRGLDRRRGQEDRRGRGGRQEGRGEKGDPQAPGDRAGPQARRVCGRLPASRLRRPRGHAAGRQARFRLQRHRDAARPLALRDLQRAQGRGPGLRGHEADLPDGRERERRRIDRPLRGLGRRHLFRQETRCPPVRSGLPRRRSSAPTRCPRKP